MYWGNWATLFLVEMIADLATQYFIDQDTMQPNISGLILAGFDYLMEALCLSGRLDPTLRDKVLCHALVSYAGDSGFNEAIDLSSKFLADGEFVQEKHLVRKFFAEAMADMSGDPWNCVFGVKETLKALESGGLKSLMVCENMDISRYVVINSVT
ncbi:hypothetical protein MKW94_014830, partial [Papaver nudicaule]|nr:hypothetical protein [Papaver nudicaule]